VRDVWVNSQMSVIDEKTGGWRFQR